MMSLDTLKARAKTKAVYSIDWEKCENLDVRAADLATFQTARDQLAVFEPKYEELLSKYWEADPTEVKNAEATMLQLYGMVETEKVYVSVLELMG